MFINKHSTKVHIYGSLQLSPGVIPYVSHNYKYVPPQRGRFLCCSGLTCPFWPGIGYGFQGNYGSVWTHCSFQFQMSKKERERFYIYIYIYIFVCCSNLSINDDINFLVARSEFNGCEKWHFLIWNRIRI